MRIARYQQDNVEITSKYFDKNTQYYYYLLSCNRLQNHQDKTKSIKKYRNNKLLTNIVMWKINLTTYFAFIGKNVL